MLFTIYTVPFCKVAMETSTHIDDSAIERRQKSPRQQELSTYIDMGMLKLALELKRGSRSYEQTAKDAEPRVPGIHLSTLYNAERGIVPSLNSYIKLCMWLGVTLDKFIHPDILPLLGVDPARIANHKVTPIRIDEG